MSLPVTDAQVQVKHLIGAQTGHNVVVGSTLIGGQLLAGYTVGRVASVF